MIWLRILAWGVAAAWVGKLMEAARGLRRVPNLLASEFDREPECMPSVVVIVPARNEEAAVGACMGSVLGQDYPELRVIAVDDRSTDGTGAILDELAVGSEGRLEVMHVDALPEGWLGKTHAMTVAARRAMAEGGAEYLLFTDADIVFEASAVRRALVRAEESGADHFVVIPTTIAKSWGEAMMLGFLQVMGLWAVRPWRVDDPKALRDAIGVGAFNLMRTAAYEQLGGFEVAPMEILEDLTLGRRVKRAGLRQRVAFAPGMVSVHWAAGVTGIVRGMTKNLFAVFQFRPGRLMTAAMGIGVFCLGPVALAAGRETRAAGVVSLAAVVGLYVLSGMRSRIGAGSVVGFPVAAALVVYSMLRSMVVTLMRGGVTWRGTFYSLAELRRADGRQWEEEIIRRKT